MKVSTLSSIRLRQPHTASHQGISTIGQLVLRDIPSSQSSPGQMSSFAKNFIDFLQLRSYNIWNNETTSCAYKVGSLWVPVLPSYLVTMVQLVFAFLQWHHWRQAIVIYFIPMSVTSDSTRLDFRYDVVKVKSSEKNDISDIN